MNFEAYRGDMEAIKVSLESCARLGLDRKEILVNSIGHFLKYYGQNEEKENLLGAVLHLRVYLELGFLYEEHEGMFDKVLNLYGGSVGDMYGGGIYVPETIKLNKSQVRNMLRRWYPAKQNAMKIGQVVEDIIKKVKEKKEGVHFYKNHAANSVMGNDVYELVINKKECYFHDINFGRYFVFRE